MMSTLRKISKTPRLPRLRWLVALVVLTSTPGLSELVEGVVHAAVASDSEDALDVHHEVDDCGDPCSTGGCTQGFFHSCRCNAPAFAPTSTIAPLAAPLSHAATGAIADPMGTDLAAHREPPFRPPSA